MHYSAGLRNFGSRPEEWFSKRGLAQLENHSTGNNHCRSNLSVGNKSFIAIPWNGLGICVLWKHWGPPDWDGVLYGNPKEAKRLRASGETPNMICSWLRLFDLDSPAFVGQKATRVDRPFKSRPLRILITRTTHSQTYQIHKSTTHTHTQLVYFAAQPWKKLPPQEGDCGRKQQKMLSPWSPLEKDRNGKCFVPKRLAPSDLPPRCRAPPRPPAAPPSVHGAEMFGDSGSADSPSNWFRARGMRAKPSQSPLDVAQAGHGALPKVGAVL